MAKPDLIAKPNDPLSLCKVTAEPAMMMANAPIESPVANSDHRVNPPKLAATRINIAAASAAQNGRRGACFGAAPP